MPKLQGYEWDSSLPRPPWNWGDQKKIKEIKKHIKKALEESQGKFCAYCGMRLELTSEIQIEHIAPKGENRYPQFMFHCSNLVLSCSLCNGFLKKEREENYDTIVRLDTEYEKSDFNIVHPYLDDPSKHLELGRNGDGILIKSTSDKGAKTIDVFKLDEEPQTTARGEHFNRYLKTFDEKYRQDYEAACSRIGI